MNPPTLGECGGSIAELGRRADQFRSTRLREIRRSYAAARASGCIAAADEARACLCAPCLKSCGPPTRDELETLGVLRVATAEDIRRFGYCCSCGADLSILEKEITHG